MENKELGLNQSPYYKSHNQAPLPEEEILKRERFNKAEFKQNGRFGVIDSGPRTFSRKSWPQMGKQMWSDVAELSQKEAQLLAIETKQKLHDMKQGGISFTLCSVFTLTTVHLIAAGLVILLADIMALWLAAFVGAMIFLIVSTIFFISFQKKVNSENLAPKRFFESMKHFSDLIKEKRNELLQH